MAKWNLDKLSNKGKTMTKYTRTEILNTAKQLVNVDRASEHGDMENNFESIAALWEIYFDNEWSFTSTDVAAMMALLKIARMKSNKSNPDNWIDACGYLACGGELSADKPEPEPVVKFQGGNT